jgi:hypothetical protein
MSGELPPQGPQFHETLWRHELDGLVSLSDPSPAQKRRIAELYELFDDDETAYVWWGYAAAAGDRDAIDMVELLTEQRKEKET